MTDGQIYKWVDITISEELMTDTEWWGKVTLLAMVILKKIIVWINVML